MIEKQKKRIEISDEFKWDLEYLVKDEKDFNNKYEKLEKSLNKLVEYKGKILDSKESFKEFLKLKERTNQEYAKLYYYSENQFNVDTTDNKSLSYKLKVENLNKIFEKLSFIENELISGKDKIIEYLKSDETLKIYNHYFENLFRYSDHILSADKEELMSKVSTGITDLGEIFDNIDSTDVKFENIKDENNKEIELTHGNYSKYIHSKKRSVRKNAFIKMHAYYKNLINTITSTYRGKIKLDLAFSKIRNYTDSLEASLFEENISRKVYENLIKSIHNNLKYLQEYIELKKKILKLKDIHLYDLYVNPSFEKEVSYNESKDIILEALKPLGDEYLTNLKQAFSNKWIDVYPNIGKKSGAYCSGGIPEHHPYVLMNYNDSITSLNTLIHELGHAMHSYYSNNNQEYIYRYYTIFLAEIASTVNELLLNEYLYRNAKTKTEKIYYVVNLLEKLRTTIYRQTMFAEFEMKTHDKEKNNIPLTVNELCDSYYELNKEYFGKNVIVDEEIKYEWARIPHFYRPFYVYKYATGMSYALIIVNKLLNNEPGFKEKYIKFLSSGSKDYSKNILKELGIDIENKNIVDDALKIFKEKTDELNKLLNEVNQ